MTAALPDASGGGNSMVPATIPAHDFKVGNRAFFVVSSVLTAMGALGVLDRHLHWPLPPTPEGRAAPSDFVLVVSSWSFLAVGTMALLFLTGLTRPPPNTPKEYVEKMRSSGKRADDGSRRVPTLVCLGDSLTHGTCSANFVSAIPTDARIASPPSPFAASGLEVINAGQNSICTHTVLRERVRDVAACDPTYVVVLIGSNDVLAVYRDDWAQDKVQTWDLPERPTLEGIGQNIKGIVRHLLDNTDAKKVAVCTLPPMGEDMSARSNDLIREANVIIERAVGEARKGKPSSEGRRVEVIDLFSALKKEIAARRQQRRDGGGRGREKFHAVDDFLGSAVLMGMLRYTFGISWNALTRVTGNTVLSDSLHLNEDGRDVVVTAIVECLLK